MTRFLLIILFLFVSVSKFVSADRTQGKTCDPTGTNPDNTCNSLVATTLFPPPTYGGYCNDESENWRCQPSETLRCIRETCDCKTPLLEVWDYERETCVKLHGAFCSPGEKSWCDPDRSICDVDPLSHTGYSCRCDGQKGFSPDFDGNCYKSHNQTCDNSEWCNGDAGLFCIDGICRCQYEQSESQRWNPRKQVCASLEGHKCDIMDDSRILQCDDGLECIPSFGPLNGFCRKSDSSPVEPPTPEPILASAMRNYQTFCLISMLPTILKVV